jgi:hypothetical protein
MRMGARLENFRHSALAGTEMRDQVFDESVTLAPTGEARHSAFRWLKGVDRVKLTRRRQRFAE